jgi:hypothetical protein
MGGQACVFDGAVEFSRNTDLAILASSENLAGIHLLYLFSKGEQANLSPDQTRIIGALSQRIREERES